MANRLERWSANPRRWQWALIGYAFLVAGVVAAFLVLRGQNEKLEDAIAANRTAVVALCALRVQLEAQIETTENLLDEDPEGEIFGIPRDLIEAGLERDRSLLTTMAGLSCPPPTVPSAG